MSLTMTENRVPGIQLQHPEHDLWDNRNGPGGACNTSRSLTRSLDSTKEGLPSMVPETCTLESCTRPVRALQMCQMHYARQKRTGSTDLSLKPTIRDRFWTKVDKAGECWEWTGQVMPNGYGRFWLVDRQVYAHRAAWEIAHGPIPDGKQVDHRCHNTRCVNPDHLRVVTPKQNVENYAGARADSKSRIRGVFWNTSHNRWTAKVQHNGRTHRAGDFMNITDAEAAVVALRNQLFTHNDADRRLV